MAGNQGRSSAVVWWVAVVVVLLMNCGGALAATYEVGDKAGWTIPTAANEVDYTTWADSNTYRVNDVLHFTYANGSHNVQQLGAASYSNCKLCCGDGYILISGGNTSITLSAAGPAYFISAIPEHCEMGMKFQINVLAATAGPPGPVAEDSSAPPSILVIGSDSSAPLSILVIGSDSSAPLSILVIGSLAVIVLASTMLLSSF